MSTPEMVENLELLPNRLAVAEFSEYEVDMILGDGGVVGGSLEKELRLHNFNWVAAYLVEEIGFHEDEVADWFRNDKNGLEGEAPIDVWQSPDGFMRVFEYAQIVKQHFEEDLDGGKEMDTYTQGIKRSHELGRDALKVINRAFNIVGIDKNNVDRKSGKDVAIHNPDLGDSLVISWRPRETIEHFRIDRKNQATDRISTYFIVRYLEDGVAHILQTGIGESVKSNGDSIHTTDTDIDGRPPSAGQIANFVVPVANETRNHTLELMTV